jgi:hypothetical protein
MTKLTRKDLAIIAAVGEYSLKHFNINPVDVAGGLNNYVKFIGEAVEVIQTDQSHETELMIDMMREVFDKVGQED